MDAVTNVHDNANLLELSYMAEYLYYCNRAPAEEVASKAIKAEMWKQNHVTSAAGILLRFG